MKATYIGMYNDTSKANKGNEGHIMVTRSTKICMYLFSIMFHLFRSDVYSDLSSKVLKATHTDFSKANQGHECKIKGHILNNMYFL